MKYEDLERNAQYIRRDDMSPGDELQLVLQEDGDVCIQIYKEGHRMPAVLNIEFCTIGSGGGRSPHTIRALRELVLAIAKDNEENPIPCQ